MHPCNTFFIDMTVLNSGRVLESSISIYFEDKGKLKVLESDFSVFE